MTLGPVAASAREAVFDLLACPACAGALRVDDDPAPSRAEREGAARLECETCGARYDTKQGVASLRMTSDDRTEAVRTFYAAAPFPGYPQNASLEGLRLRATRSEFARLLDRAIPGDARIVEVGCGTG